MCRRGLGHILVVVVAAAVAVVGIHWRGVDYRDPEVDPVGIHFAEAHCTAVVHHTAEVRCVAEGIGWRVATVGEEVGRSKKGDHSAIANLVDTVGHRIVDPDMGDAALEAGNIRRCMGERESCCLSARTRELRGNPSRGRQENGLSF